MTTKRAGRTVSLFVGREKVFRFGAQQPVVHLVPCRPGGSGFAAPHAQEGAVRHLPCARAGAACQVSARQSQCARRCAGPALRQLPRQSRYPAGEGQELGRGADEGAVRLRTAVIARARRFRRNVTSISTTSSRITPRASTAKDC